CLKGLLAMSGDKPVPILTQTTPPVFND
ncbi:MAG: polyketide cyclase, partial [Myxococcaceae bacterium]